MRKSFVIIRLIGGKKDGDFVYLQGLPDFYFADQAQLGQKTMELSFSSVFSI